MTPTVVPPIDPEEEIDFMHIDEKDFFALNRTELIRHFEVEGYVVFPAILDSATIARLHQELADAEMEHTNYSGTTNGFFGGCSVLTAFF